ncbi:MAG: HDIG domain-containing protein [Desulfobacteraceae bacterium]|nr:HDIG domain-containing protein [Desulfobacteraceae bacterium]
MNTPTKEECFRLIHKMNMMDHIIDHSIIVSNVALCLCRFLGKKFPDINIQAVCSAALLHDITKTRSFSTGEIHSDTGGLLLKAMGYPEIGNIIRQHVTLDIYTDGSPISEQEIVNYADKRVLHTQVVSLEKRLEYIRVKYGTKPEFKHRIQSMWEATLHLERKLFQQLPFKPSQLSDLVLPTIKKR